MKRPHPTQREVTFDTEEIIVSKTDLKGHLTYVNDVFLRVSGFTEDEVMGQPHNLIRHPDMPRGVFALLWERIQSGKEIFAFVKNIAASGDHYWVFAHVTPTLDARGQIAGFHSNRRTPNREVLPAIEALYAKLLAVEARHARGPAQIAASRTALDEALGARGQSYDQFIFSLEDTRSAA